MPRDGRGVERRAAARAARPRSPSTPRRRRASRFGQHELHLAPSDAVDLLDRAARSRPRARAGSRPSAGSRSRRARLVEELEAGVAAVRQALLRRARRAPCVTWLDMTAIGRAAVARACRRCRRASSAFVDLAAVGRGQAARERRVARLRRRSEKQEVAGDEHGDARRRASSWPRGSRLLQSLGGAGERAHLDLHPEDLVVRVDGLVADLDGELQLEARLLDRHRRRRRCLGLAGRELLRACVGAWPAAAGELCRSRARAPCRSRPPSRRRRRRACRP